MADKSFLLFREVQDTGKTKVYSVDGKFSGGMLGLIRWYGPWRRYVYYPSDGTLYDAGCLKEVTTFIDDLMAARKQK